MRPPDIAWLCVAALIVMSVILAIAGFAAEAKCDHLGYPGGGVTLTLEPYCLGEADLEKRDRIRRWNQRTLLKDIQ